MLKKLDLFYYSVAEVGGQHRFFVTGVLQGLFVDPEYLPLLHVYPEQTVDVVGGDTRVKFGDSAIKVGLFFG